MNFHGFTNGSFEQFIRAVAVKILGPGVTAFGNGPDGGREAAFSGLVNFPHPPTNLWNGYGVVQAKFKEKLEDTQKEQSWAVQQLEKELNVWCTSEKRIPKPDYYIFCTNVELTSGEGGGRDKVKQVFEKYSSQLKIKDYHIWDANQLKVYIDTTAELRKRFQNFFTEGDLMFELLKLVEQSDLELPLHAYICKELIADEDSRLGQGGDRSEDKIKLADVFIDLPASLVAASDPPEESEDQKLPPASLSQLLKASEFKLDPAALYEAKTRNDDDGRFWFPKGRFVFIGGPGSGKSTLGQFLAQIHRAALLARRPPHRLELKVASIVEEVRKRCEKDKLTWPKSPRYPFRVELNAFAKALTSEKKEKVETLSEYFRKRISSDVKITHQNLVDWFKVFPSLIILDGLDEVPSSSNRNQVIEAIQSFLNEMREVEADLMIVSSSRPDGYSGEFNGDDVVQQFILPLSKARAVACARSYLEAKGKVKGDHWVESSMTQMKESVRNQLVEKLMRSPLQVTFMVTVVTARGKPSESRWQLFDDYYRTIYERELHKAVPPFDEVLRERRQDIDELHHRIGFILQRRGEESGGPSELAVEEFERLVRSCLAENGLAGADLDKQTGRLVDAAKLRLVFLTSRTPNRLSFEVRSLQEYMAAACITNTEAGDVFERLKLIIGSAYWRNTVIFALGRFFVEARMRKHREKVRLLCEDANLTGREYCVVKLGSRIALEIFESGIVGDVPLVNQSLAKCALELMCLPADKRSTLVARLSNIYSSTVENQMRECLPQWLGHRDVSRSLAAWLLALRLEEKGAVWVTEMINKFLPESVHERCEILSAYLRLCHDQNLHPTGMGLLRTSKLIPQIAPSEYDRFFSFVRFNGGFDLPQWFVDLTKRWSGSRTITVPLRFEKDLIDVSVMFNGVEVVPVKQLTNIEQILKEPECHQSWAPLLNVLKANDAELGGALRVLAEKVDPTEWRKWKRVVSWPLASMLDSAEDAKCLGQLADVFESGGVGGFDEWKQMEEGWLAEGLDCDVFLKPFKANLATLSAPLLNVRRNFSFGHSGQEEGLKASRRVLKKLQELENGPARDAVLSLFKFQVAVNETLQFLDPDELRSLYSIGNVSLLVGDFAINPDAHEYSDSRWVEFFESIGRNHQLKSGVRIWNGVSEDQVSWLLKHFNENPKRDGLLRFAGLSVVSTDCFAPSDFSILPEEQAGLQTLERILLAMGRRGLSRPEALKVVDMIKRYTAKNPSKNDFNMILSCIENHAVDIPMLSDVLFNILELIDPAEYQFCGRAVRCLDLFVQKRMSCLDTAAIAHHSLPLIS